MRTNLVTTILLTIAGLALAPHASATCTIVGCFDLDPECPESGTEAEVRAQSSPLTSADPAPSAYARACVEGAGASAGPLSPERAVGTIIS